MNPVDTEHLIPVSRFSPHASALIVDGLNGLLLAGILVALLFYFIHRRRAAATQGQGACHHRNWALALLAALVLINVVPLGPYNGLRLFGHVIEATPQSTWITKSSERVRRGHSRLVVHHMLQATALDPAGAPITLSAEVSHSLYQAVREGKQPRVPFLVAPRLGLSQLGARPTLSGAWLLAMITVLELLLAQLISIVRVRAFPIYTKAEAPAVPSCT